MVLEEFNFISLRSLTFDCRYLSTLLKSLLKLAVSEKQFVIFLHVVICLEQRVCYLALVGVRVTCAHARTVTPESEKTHRDPEQNF